MVRLVLVVLGLCALAQINALPRKVEKRGVERPRLEKRAPGQKYVEKRHPHLAALEKRQLEERSLPKREVQYQYVVQPAQQQPSVQATYYYYQQPDGSVQYVQGAPQVQQTLIQRPPVQQQVVPAYQEVPYQAPASSSGGLFSLLAKPLSAVGKVVGVTGDVLQGVVDLPFSVAKDVVQVVGLDQSAIGKAATGILDTAATIVKAPVQLVQTVGQLPFELTSNVVSSLDGE